MKDINYKEIYNKTLIYYLEEIQKEVVESTKVYIEHSILYNLVLDLIISKKYEFEFKLNKQQQDFIERNNIDLKNGKNLQSNSIALYSICVIIKLRY
ncbi:MAG: hypothetical protein Q4D02_01690 [Clostridia bacterium]|nr:hypothetical protein [Clostridia bacterium]